MCERWVGDWTNCNILTHSSFVFSSISFSFCRAAQSGALRAHSPLLGARSLYIIFSPTNWLQLTRTVCRTGLYHCLTSTCFMWALHLHRIQPVHGQGYILMSSTGCTCSLIEGWVKSQYVTKPFNWVETITTIMCQQMNSNSFKNEITDKLCANKRRMLNCFLCKQLAVWQKWTQTRLKILSKVCLRIIYLRYNSNILNIYV